MCNTTVFQILIETSNFIVSLARGSSNAIYFPSNCSRYFYGIEEDAFGQYIFNRIVRLITDSLNDQNLYKKLKIYNTFNIVVKCNAFNDSGNCWCVIKNDRRRRRRRRANYGAMFAQSIATRYCRTRGISVCEAVYIQLYYVKQTSSRSTKGEPAERLRDTSRAICMRIQGEVTA